MKFLCISLLMCILFAYGLTLQAAEDTRDLHHIPFHFFVYEKPCLMSPVVAAFNPQYVVVLERAYDGWGLISTSDGPGWAFLPGDRFFVPRRLGLHSYVGEEAYTTLISPQIVTVLDSQESWRLIGTWLGPKWINLNFRPSTAGLDAYLRRFGNNIAVFYMDIETGFTYMYNPDVVFFSASVNKIQHALYLFTLAERGLLDLNRIHTYRASDYWGGTGRIRTRYAFGRQFTTRELLYYSIRYSDNIAFRMLVRNYGLDGYLEFVREIGANEYLVRNITGANVTARDAGLWMRAVHEHLVSGVAYSDIFQADLMNTNLTLIHADYLIANKYGWATHSFHDMAIVYADSPYILVILSNMDHGAFGTFASISRRIEAFHRTYF